MDKDNKRAQRRKDEQTIWMRRLNNAFNNSKYYVKYRFYIYKSCQ